MNLSARPTEYSGTLFRSKTEAVYARCFDLMKFLWQYEPSWINFNGYTPDFVVSLKSRDTRDLLFMISEVKPSRPTDAYISELAARFTAIDASLCNRNNNGNRVGFCPGYSLIYGDPWAGSEATMTMFSSSEDDKSDIGPLVFFRSTSFKMPFKRALEYRFDLRQEAV